ncbi:late endosomal/lysosomal adaptor and MAPK and MTOR activator-domain-containing protein [Talaromyces proteolyticus]|uniref:Late endosomal/lysosomal adaptor and MAPK and MTOR activator-domain-containing protein n=1 Tax=Talaromyces proteolyticus TaxID=1131652 RepID=A0AAD4L0N9_9EURO|nr:late endosomal/lysosomal adaptor and MAPK and MTOR activator-domain-containing protein [Talaromyces proteolyticus]KAH8704924.1 late endosomal/lysosomal adaptor and MAPK and MTOR activator-domain-containing protein [Talaromyces proteolyticus]
MGACQSCLGLGSREENEPEHARLIEDEIFPGSYGYGSVNHPNHQQSDPEDLKREREALEAICQRASDSVVDIWSSHPHLQPQATLRSNNGSATSSRVPSNETATATADGTPTVTATATPSGTIKKSPPHNLAPIPKNWGEVVVSPRRKGKNTTQSNTDIFGVLNVS